MYTIVTMCNGSFREVARYTTAASALKMWHRITGERSFYAKPDTALIKRCGGSGCALLRNGAVIHVY